MTKKVYTSLEDMQAKGEAQLSHARQQEEARQAAVEQARVDEAADRVRAFQDALKAIVPDPLLPLLAYDRTPLIDHERGQIWVQFKIEDLPLLWASFRFWKDGQDTAVRFESLLLAAIALATDFEGKYRVDIYEPEGHLEDGWYHVQDDGVTHLYTSRKSNSEEWASMVALAYERIDLYGELEGLAAVMESDAVNEAAMPETVEVEATESDAEEEPFYQIVESSSPGVVVEVVSVLMEKGWRLAGNLCVSPFDDGRFLYSQPMERD